MKLREKMKRFWTLDVHNHAGFTLVELIIVIAILAILSTGAIAGYSVYIKQANMTADQALIAEIQNALTLAGYSGTFDNGEGGYIILTVDGIINEIADGSHLDTALKTAFGDGYKNMLKLKYGEWSNNGLQYGLYDPISVYNSTYYSNSGQLMGQVEEVTGAAANILKNTGGDRQTMIDLFGSQLLIDAAESSLGMTLTEDDLLTMGETEFSNLLVFAAAYDIGIAGADEDYEASDASNLVISFAKYNGFAATEAGQTDKDANGNTFVQHYAEFIAAINAEGATAADVATAYRAIEAAANSYDAFAAYQAEGGQSETDMAAFNAMMFGVTGAATANGNLKDQLGDSNFFSSGAGSELFNTYLDSVEAAVGLGDEMAEIMEALDGETNAVAIYFTVNGYTVVIGNSLP